MESAPSRSSGPAVRLAALRQVDPTGVALIGKMWGLAGDRPGEEERR